ncbi:ATPdependent RNA helicase [Nowakowskiella sp. JEL0078]|nr:ATPdependent RNA helicase [Nowakowskiella sp. JEL0078]
MTPLGYHMALIPADLRIAKMLIFGAIFKCLSPILTVAAILSSKSPFVAPFEKRDEAKARAREKFSSSNSDLLTDVNSFEAWEKSVKSGFSNERLFCEDHFLSSTVLTSIADLRKQYQGNLRDIGFLSSNIFPDTNSSNIKLIKSVIVAGLFPNIVRIVNAQTKFLQTIAGAVEKQGKAKEIRYFSPTHGQVHLHPSSINFTTIKYDADCSFIVYHSLTETSKLFLRDSTAVSPMPILLFGGKLNPDVVQRTINVDLNASGSKQLGIRAVPRTGVLIDSLRNVLDKALEDKIKNPGLDIIEENKGIQVILSLITES